MHQTQFSEKIPYGGEIRSQLRKRGGIVGYLFAGLTVKLLVTNRLWYYVTIVTTSNVT